MFYTIHRCIKILAWCAVLMAALAIYERRQAFEPGFIWYDVWDNGGFHVAEPRRLAGRVIHVVNSQTFTISTRSNGRFNVRLMGLKPPPDATSLEGREKELARRDELKKLIDGHWVQIEISYENVRNLGGVAFLASTNVNARLVQQRAGFADKESVKGLPKNSQYALLWATRHRVDPK